MQHRQKDRTLQRKSLTAMTGKLIDDRLATGFLPPALKDERSTDTPLRHRGEFATVEGGQHPRVFGEASAGGEQ